MRRIVVMEGAREALGEYFDEIAILTGNEVAKLRRREHLDTMRTLAQQPLLGKALKSSTSEIELFRFPVAGGYFIYAATETHLQVVFFARDAEMDIVLKLLSSPKGTSH